MNKIKLMLLLVMSVFMIGATECDNHKSHNRVNSQSEFASPVPEPGAAVLFGGGMIGLMLYFRHKRKQR